MAEQLGRKVKISVNSNVLTTARTKTLTINNEMVDVTSDGDDGVQRFIHEPGQKAVEISVEGMFDLEDDTLPVLALGDDVSASVELDYGTYTISGTFVMSSYSGGKTYSDAQTFSATFQSSGAILKAPVA